MKSVVIYILCLICVSILGNINNYQMGYTHSENKHHSEIEHSSETLLQNNIIQINRDKFENVTYTKELTDWLKTFKLLKKIITTVQENYNHTSKIEGKKYNYNPVSFDECDKSIVSFKHDDVNGTLSMFIYDRKNNKIYSCEMKLKKVDNTLFIKCECNILKNN